MLGAGLQFGRSRGEDRFYIPAKARSSRRGQLNQDHFRRALSDVTASQSKAAAIRKESEYKKSVPLPAPAVVETVMSPLSNLERFLESVIPSVAAQYPSMQRSMKFRRSCGGESQPYFLLSDLWESFKEWSAYGAGVPLLLDDTDSVVQYYVPYLSGMQLYVDGSKSAAGTRRPGEDSDLEFRDSSSDGSSDYEHDRSCTNCLREQRNYNHPTGGVLQRVEHLSLRDQNNALQEGFSSDEGESGKVRDFLLFEYLERDPPFGREPLADKISDLALRFPDLKSLRSCDLRPSSWISVAWYPIYRIPMGPTLKDLDACFLTFHPLSTSMTDNANSVPVPVATYPVESDGVPRMSLPIFGFASYKFKPSLWTDNGQLVSSLMQAADNWLNSRQVSHPDFRFFCRR